MDELSTVQEYGGFRPVAPLIWGSATDVHLIDVATTVAEGGTLRAFREQWLSVPRLPLMPERALSNSIRATIGVSQGQGDASSRNSASLDELRTPEGQIRRQVVSLRATPGLLYRERLARRLEFLLAAMEDEGEAWSDDSPESLRRMMLFLQSEPSLGYPSVTVTPSATFRAQWTTDRTRHFAAEFLANGEVRFLVFGPDSRHPDRVQRVTGMANWQSLMHVVEPYNVLRWAADARA